MAGIRSWVKRTLHPSLYHEGRRLRFRYLIWRGHFHSTEQEFHVLHRLIKRGETVVDIGANVGHYTLHLSQLTGETGRVFAFEPVPSTFDLLASNVMYGKCSNVTLVNAAVTATHTLIGFHVPSGNLYRSRQDTDGELCVFGLPLLSLIGSELHVSFIKIDAEGFDEEILLTSLDLIHKSRPLVMAELTGERAKSIADMLPNYGVYGLHWSHNSVFYPLERQREVLDAFDVR